MEGSALGGLEVARRRSRKVVRYRKPISINVGVIAFFIIFCFLVSRIVVYMTKEHISFYEVIEKSISDDNICKGIAIREETICYTDSSGYINYYIGNGEKIGKNATIYTLDKTGEVYNQLASSDNEIKVSSEDSNKIKETILQFQKEYDGMDYNVLHEFKYDMESSALEITNVTLLNNLENVLQLTGDRNSFQVVTASQSGIVSYSMDGMEDITQEQITEETFQTKDYTRTQMRNSGLVENNSAVYKLITNENWQIVILLNSSQYEKVQEKERINITFLKDGLTANVGISSYQSKDQYYACLSLDQYMVRYINERFLDIELSINSARGLKIPVSALTTKDFYLVPLEFFVSDIGSSTNSIVREKYDEEGQKQYEYIETEIYYQDEEYAYIDMDIVSDGMILQKPGTNETYTIGERGTLEGVYNVNKGYSSFRRIEKIYENEEYCIIEKDTPNGLSAYDHIVVDSKTIEDDEIVY